MAYALFAQNPTKAAPGSLQTLEQRLAAEIHRQHLIRLSDDEILVIELDATKVPPSADIISLRVDPATGRLAALLATKPHPVRVSGRVSRRVELVVPGRTIHPGEIITPQDLVHTQLQSSKILPQSLTSAQQLIGKEARRVLAAGRAVDARKVGPPLLVEKNSEVDIHFATPTLTIKAKGRALEDGGLGDVVKIMNIESRKIIDARITGHETVTIVN
ncbi:hypothetical protein GCM10007972_23780 [Iodidimonas muriae]|uniref:Flagella basal body P-ring formation protein FlgA n=1 Tax=Iodidimonas muriae TaxID=261467 RepID=A0ABQ2LFU0_9PROT|nr:flagellar basal body P-ring formation chaperone FlgA [Iodidimonas muriae]GER08581.1 hypothetical protein JCM17843_28910 [Kordiimonadales bacterium JCM 17843]GGO15555.1 hypothetical protein GCM10007972_23780 [Iodidimonas muriae]